MAYVRLPDNSYFKVPEGASPEQAMQAAQQKYPKAFMSEKELESKQGFGAAVGEAFRGAKAAGYEGAGKLLGSEMLKDLSKEEYEKLEKDPSFIPTTAEDRKAAFGKGLMSGIGALGREYISEPVGGMVGRFGVPLGVGALATVAAPVLGAGALGAGVIGGAVTAAADYLPQVGENLQRQRKTGKPENLSDAALAAIPQAALSGLNLRLGMLPKGVQNIFKADAAALQKQVVAGTLKPEAAVSQLSGNLKNILLSTGSAAVVGTGTMVGEEALRRGQAGQSVLDSEAMGEYGDIALQAAAIAPLFGVPRGALRKGAEKRGIEAAGTKLAEQEGIELRAKQDAEAALLADDAFRAEQAKTGDLFAEPIRTEGPAKGKEAFGKMEGDVSPLPGVADNLTVAERERRAQERGVESQTPFEAERQRTLLAQRVEEIEARVAKAAAEGDVDTVSALSAQVQPFREALKKAEDEFKAAGPIELFPAQQLEKMQSDLAKGLKDLQKAGDLGDFDRIAKLAPQIKDLQTKIAEAKKPGPDLYAVEKDQRIGEEIRKYEDEVSARGENVQRTDTQQKQAKAEADYKARLQELEEAFSNGADKRLVDQLVDQVIKAENEKAAQIAKTSDVVPAEKIEAAQQRVERIKRALEEATAKGDGPSIVGLRNQLAKAIVETARTPVESRRSRALEDQMGAIEVLRSSVEDIKSGRYLGEGAKDTATAASMRSGIERQANEAIGKYVEAAIRDVQAMREQAGQKKMTVTEATRLAMDVRGHLEKAARNLNEAALRMPKEGTVSAIERQLAQIKKKYHAGEAPAKGRGPEGLKVEVEPRTSEAALKLAALREKGGALNPENKDLLEKVGGKPFETEARKAERLAEEAAEAQRVERSGTSPDQRLLFAPSELAPLATTRATPENFQRALRSRDVERARRKEAKEEAIKKAKATADSKKTAAQKRREETVAERKRVVEAERAAKKERTTEAARAERLENLPKVKQEVVETEFKTPGSEQRVQRKKITRDDRTLEQRREDAIEAQKDAQKQAAERRAPARARQKLAQALAQESELNKQLKALRKEQGKQLKAKEAIEASKEKAKTEKSKNYWQERLDEVSAKIDEAKFESRARVLETQLKELESIGAKTERVMEVAGNKPGRVERTKPLRVGKTIGEKYDLKKEFEEAKRNAEIDDLKFVDDYDGTEVAQFRGRSGTDYRAEAPVTGKRIDAALAKQVSDAIEKNAPKDVKLKSVDTYAELPPAVKKLMERDGIVEGSIQSQTVRGFVTPDGDVYVVRGNHESVKDMERTYTHELIGHAGVDRILGKEGMEALTKRMNAQGGAMELARKLGVDENVKGAMDDYALSIAKMTRDGASKADIDKALKNMETQAVRELLAYTAEQRVDENFKQKAGRWVQEVVGAIRAALRKMGMAELSKVTTADIFNILRQSQKNYNKGQLGAFRDTNGNIAFRSKPVFSPSIPAGEVATVGKAVASDKPFKDRIKGNAIGMSMMHRFVDRFAGLDYIARNMRDKLEGVQMMYYNRLYDQRNNMIAEIATHGSVGLERNTDGSYQYKSRKGPSLKNVFESVNKAKSEFGNAQATLNYFGAYLAMERAASNKGGLKAGLEKLDLSGKFSEADANAILKRGRANTHFQDARKAYRQYNNGMLDLMVESGRLDKAQAAEMKKGDYVPYYRDRNGEIVDTENNIRVGDIKTQAYLKELVGGDSAIVNFETGALQNTYMLTDMAMSNIASKNTAYTLNKLGMAEIRQGSGPAKANIIRFYEDGKQKYAEINTRGNYMEIEARLEKMREAGKANTTEYKKLREKAEAARASEGAFGDIPADLIVKGMEGVATAMPAGVAMMRRPANLLRKAVTRNPAYALRIALKDSLSGWIVSGADVKPVVSTFAALKKSWQGDSPEVRALQEQGIIGGHAFAGTMSDMRTIAQQIAQGQSGWEKLWAKSDRMAMMADEAQRLSLYNGFIKKGMSPMEATLATLESQNFTKHGYSPTAKALSTMIPFFNAQIQGLNAFARAITGTSLFQDKLGVREQMLKRGMMLAGATMAYSALMQNNEAYKNATETDKLNYWFVPLPFMDEPVRVPIPFEAGAVFKAIPESIYNLMASDSKSKDVLPAVGRLALNSIPGMSNMFLPQGIKPAIELTTGTSFFTMEGIESARQKSELPGYRAGTNTTEVSKAIGQALNVSPIQIDHAINGYTASLGIALLSMFNPLLRDADVPESKASQTPIFGGFFQPTDGVGLINKAYEDMIKIEQVNSTFKRLEERDPDEADKFLDKYLDTLDKVSAAGKFKKDMGELNKEERIIRGDKEMTAAQKREAMDEIKQVKIEIAKEFMSISRE